MEQNLLTCMDKIYEIRDGMLEAIKNATKVLEEQDELANIVVRAKGKKHDFKEFVKDTKEAIVGYKNQVEVLKEKVAYANAIIDLYEKGAKPDASEEDRKIAMLVEQSVTTLCLLLSIVPTENEQRIEAERQKAAEEERKKNLENSARNVKA